MTTTDSNAWGGLSGHTYTFTPLPDGKTRVDAIVVRDGKNLKGRFFAVVFRVFGTAGPGRRVPEDHPGHRAAQQRNAQVLVIDAQVARTPLL